jgi:DNA-directed RNA polymerase subunit RPC12/RpoP
MSEAKSLHGLNCPRCGGTVPIPEGQAVVKCPYCDMRSLVRGERGVRRYQVPCRVERATAVGRLGTFLSSNLSIAFNAKSSARVTEAFLAYLPFWTTWARVLGWVFGQERKGSGKNRRWVPREVKVTRDMVWNGAACDVGEFGVATVPLTTQPMEPFNADQLHANGLVFEPVTSISEAQQAAEQTFEQRVRKESGVDRIAQVFTRAVNERFGVVYYPLWVLRYTYRERAYQLVVDGFSGEVLYGKAPGNTLYRAAALVGGMALGAFVSVDVSTALLGLIANSDSGDDMEGVALAALAAVGIGFGIMWGAYRAFRYGEVYEYRRDKPPLDVAKPAQMLEEATQWLKMLR